MANQLPQGWKEEELGNIADVGNGDSAPQASSYFINGSYPFCRTSDVGKIHRSSAFNKIEDYINETAIPKLHLFKKGTILFPKSGASTLLNHRVMLAIDSYVSSHLATIYSKKINPLYLYYFLCTIDAKKLVPNLDYPSLKISTLKNIKIIYPTDEKEQQYIVDTLDAVAEMIRLRKETIQLTQDLIPSIFQEMFGDPITNPKGWEIKTFRDVLTIKNGKNQKGVENVKGKYPIYGSAGEIIGYANDFICNENSVIIGRKGNINAPKVIKTKFWNVDTAFGLEPNKTLNYNYLYVFCLLYNFEKHNRAVVLPSLVKSDLLEIKIPLPLLSLQEEFSNRIEQVNENLEIQQKDLTRLQDLFDQLLQKAFTGELTRGEVIDGVI